MFIYLTGIALARSLPACGLRSATASWSMAAATPVTIAAANLIIMFRSGESGVLYSSAMYVIYHKNHNKSNTA
jgi:hypothetical protein